MNRLLGNVDLRCVGRIGQRGMYELTEHWSSAAAGPGEVPAGDEIEIPGDVLAQPGLYRVRAR